MTPKPSLNPAVFCCLLSLESPEVRRKREGLATCAGDQELAAAFPLAPGGRAEADAVRAASSQRPPSGARFTICRADGKARPPSVSRPPSGQGESCGAHGHGGLPSSRADTAPRRTKGGARPAPRRERPRPASFPTAEPKACGCCSSRRSRTLS